MRTVDPYKIRLVTTGTTIEDKKIVIPIGNAFDGIGKNQEIEDYVEKLADDSVNPIVDYEKMRYTPYSGTLASSGVTETMGYDFYFYGEPSNLDYKLTETKENQPEISFEDAAYIQIGEYVTKNSFKYSSIHTELTLTFDNFYLRCGKAPTSTIVDADTTLNSNDIKIITKVGLSNVNTAGAHITITPAGSSYSSTFANFDVWVRHFNVTVTYITGFLIPPSEVFSVEAKFGVPGVVGFVGDYTVNYKAVSSEVEGYYTDYTADKIQSLYIENSFKGYTNSYFRLDYFDSVLEEAQNLLFTDVLTVSEGAVGESIFTTKLNKQNYFLYWLKNDPIIEEQGYRDVYMTARFFNASTGQIQQFFNVDDDWTQPLTVSYIPNIDEYETLLKYVKVRLFKDYTYIVCKRSIALPTSATTGWGITDDTSSGVNKVILNQIRIK